MPKDKKKKLYTATYTFEGKRYYVRSSVSQRDADKKAAKAQQEREDGSLLIGDDIRVADYAIRWAKTYKSTTVSDSVYHAYTARIDNHIIPIIGPLKMKNVRPTNLQEIMNNQAGKSKTHCDKLLVTIRAIFHQAVKDGVIRRDPSEDISAPKATDGTHRTITTEERAAALSVAETNRFGLAIKLMLCCGLRPQEAAALRWCDIDQVNRRLMIRHAVKKSGTIGEPKSSAGKRNIPIPPMLWDSFKFPDNLDAFVLTNTRGEYFSYTSMRRAWSIFKREMDLALGAETEKNADGKTKTRYGVPVIVKSVIASDLDMYCFRHTYCTDLESAGVPLNVAKYLMGHSSIVLTSKIYTHMREDTLSSAAEKIAAIGATVGATPKLEKGIKSVQKAGEECEAGMRKVVTK
ncbi:site-specific integrase [Agathobaculum sp. NTUH-O15-33]|uniref:tyrosine-type recombinase/integrase n=1 Tax=Agathobaculum sp. NTUH-O15-33 TaxID=3079302 RepID=UPI0029584BF5|nr:site-specific integrase [Agathobaculum sp. NTUH-O15-33]WNX85216.1 site-specific integrase [Agathobaculum sp. NTUH-O15-33]